MTARQQIARLLPLVLLVILVVAGLRGEVAAPRWNGPLKADGVAIGLALEVILGALLIVVLRRDAAARRLAGRRPYSAEPLDLEPPAALRFTLRWVLGAAIVAVATVLISDLHLHFLTKGKPAMPPPVKIRPHKTALPQGAGGGGALHIPWVPILYGLLVVVLVAAVVISIWWSSRLRQAAAPLVIEDMGTEDLREAVESGRAALAEISDARAAIIACYAGDGAQPGRPGHPPHRGRHPGRAAGPGGRGRNRPRPRRQHADRPVLRGPVLHPPGRRPPARGRQRRPRRTGNRTGRRPVKRPAHSRQRRRPGMSTAPLRPANGGVPNNNAGDPDGSRWRDATPELIIAAILVAVAALAGAAVSGWPGVVVVAAAAAVLALLLLRAALPRSAAQAFRLARDKQRARAISGYGQRRFIVATSLTSRPLYESDLRPVLEHVLAARLAESHGVNLYTEPEAARRAFCRTGADESVWPWIDPAQALDADQRSRQRRGIPRQALARLITRLEQL